MDNEIKSDLYALLKDGFHGLPLQRSFDLSRHTTMGAGGCAQVAASPRSYRELAALLRFLVQNEIPHCLLGAGANVLFSDGCYAGVVVRSVRLNGVRAEGTAIRAGAGATGAAILSAARQAGIGGLEFLAGIPMSAGGAVAMNAGVADGHIGDVTQEVLAADGDLRVFSNEECRFGTKCSAFGKIAVAEVLLRGYPSSPREIGEKIGGYLERRSRLPKGRSAGCIFVNPEGMSAGALIERCGLKGMRVGKAFVSAEHANFIINGGATAAEIGALIDLVKAKVLEKTGIGLREEVRRLP